MTYVGGARRRYVDLPPAGGAISAAALEWPVGHSDAEVADDAFKIFMTERKLHGYQIVCSSKITLGHIK